MGQAFISLLIAAGLVGIGIGALNQKETGLAIFCFVVATLNFGLMVKLLAQMDC